MKHHAMNTCWCSDWKILQTGRLEKYFVKLQFSVAVSTGTPFRCVPVQFARMCERQLFSFDIAHSYLSAVMYVGLLCSFAVSTGIALLKTFSSTTQSYVRCINKYGNGYFTQLVLKDAFLCGLACSMLGNK